MKIHWRNTARPVRFINIDARAAFPLLLFLMHMRLWTFLFAISVIAVFFILERFGLTVPLALRRARLFIIGLKRPALLNTKRHIFLDRGGE